MTTTKEVPDIGGIYTEGILADSINALNEDISYLTHVGLTKLDSLGNISPAVAKSWTITPDGKNYSFILQKSYSSTEISQYFQKQKGSWEDVQILTPDEHTIQFVLKQPFGLFLASTLRPVLPYGPYKIEEQTENRVVLTKNELSYTDTFIEKLIFEVYPDQEKLDLALKKGKVSGADTALANKNLRVFRVSIPRINVAFLNSERIADKNIRKQILTGPAFSTPVNLKMLQVDTPSAAKFADNFIKKLNDNNIIVSKKVLSSTTALTESQKDYDILICGLNLGYYGDLYPYWHSTQQPPQGMNHSKLKNKVIDRLIEEARITLDEKLRKEKFTQAENVVKEEYIFFADQPVPYQFTVNKKIKGINFKTILSPANRFSFISFWYINTKRIKK